VPGPSGFLLRRIRTEAEGAGAGPVHAVPAVAVRVLRAADGGAAMAVGIGGRRAPRVLVAGPAVVTGNQLALVRVGACPAGVAARACGAGVATGARQGRAGPVRLTASADAAAVGTLGADRWGWRRVPAAAVLALGAPRRRARAGPAHITVAGGGALKTAAHGRAQRGRDRARRSGPARLAGATLVRTDRPAFIADVAGLGSCRGARRLAGADAPGPSVAPGPAAAPGPGFASGSAAHPSGSQGAAISSRILRAAAAASAGALRDDVAASVRVRARRPTTGDRATDDRQHPQLP